jgi:hypothetical protein
MELQKEIDLVMYARYLVFKEQVSI